MEKIGKIIKSGILIFAVMFFAKTASAGDWEVTFMACTDNCSVIRCDYGDLDCNPSSQGFCRHHLEQKQ